MVLRSAVFLWESNHAKSQNIKVSCSGTPTTFGDLRAANGQGQQRRRITSVQPPTGLQEWLKMFQVTCLNTVLEMLHLVAVTIRDYSAMKRNMLHHG